MPEHPHSVVVIDDDESMCQALTRLLTASGFMVRSYFSAEAFLDDLGAPAADSLVVDVGLPGLSGLELVSQLRTRHTFSSAVTFMSAHDDREISREALSLGCVAFLNKPFPGQTLIAALRLGRTLF